VECFCRFLASFQITNLFSYENKITELADIIRVFKLSGGFGMSVFFVPTLSAEDWKPLLAKPDKHWRTGYSAKSLAYCWHSAGGRFPNSVQKVFKSSGNNIFQNIKMLVAFPEYKTFLPPVGGRPSQSDIFILARGDSELVSIVVEGKALEGFGETVNEWLQDTSPGKITRLNYLLGLLSLKSVDVESCKYQLLHRTASAVIEADKFNAKVALMLIHSFGDDPQAFSDYRQFLTLFNVNDVPENSIVYGKKVGS